ncbi:hypothetical protein TcBrA4_0116980 [Trypanosoma cruzi]|nr:hypothetical protein TcBrA4_0116980 [Trypanosoma cruzi]
MPRQSSVWRSRCGAACSSCALTNGRRRRLRRAESSGFWSSTPYLDGVALAGLPLSKLGLSEDEEFTRLAEEHTVLAASPEKNAEALAAKEQCLKARAAQLAAAVVKQEAALREQMPYLMHLPFDVALREPAPGEQSRVCGSPCEARGSVRGPRPCWRRGGKAAGESDAGFGEENCGGRGGGPARALVETENLHEKYPCLPEEPAPGVAIVEVGLVEDPVFHALSHELDGLRADPTKNAKQIGGDGEGGASTGDGAWFREAASNRRGATQVPISSETRG